jgi:hypothetical protein
LNQSYHQISVEQQLAFIVAISVKITILTGEVEEVVYTIADASSIAN